MNPAAASPVPLLDSRRVKEQLPDARRIAIRTHAARAMIFGEHWAWRHGAEYYTPAGLRFLADAHEREHDHAGALVCRALAAELEAPAPLPASDPAATCYANLERRGLA